MYHILFTYFNLGNVSIPQRKLTLKQNFFTYPKLVPKHITESNLWDLNEIGSVCFKRMPGYKLDKTEVTSLTAFVFGGKNASLQVPTFLVLNLPKLFMKRNYRVERELENFR